MPSDKNSVEDLLHKYLVEEGTLKERLDRPEFDYGFIISYPPGPKSKNLSIYKPKKMNGIFITVRFQISKEKTEVLDAVKVEEKHKFFDDVRKFLLIREVFFKLDLQNAIVEIHEHIYPNKEGYFAKNSLFKLIQKVFYCYIFINLLLEEFCIENNQPDTKTRLFG